MDTRLKSRQFTMDELAEFHNDPVMANMMKDMFEPKVEEVSNHYGRFYPLEDN